MQFLLLGLALLVLVLLAGRSFAQADPKLLARRVRRIGGVGALILAIVFAATGRLVLAVPLIFLGFSLLGRAFPWPDTGGGAAKSHGQRSSVRTDMLEMVLDHDTGFMDGVVLTGPFRGRRLSELSGGELSALLSDTKARDPQAAQLLEAFIDRTGRGGGSQRSSGGGPGPAGMAIEEAYEVLGLKPGATRDQVQAAHRALMKKYHPDQGGSTYLASKINEAKEVLIRLLG